MAQDRDNRATRREPVFDSGPELRDRAGRPPRGRRQAAAKRKRTKQTRKRGPRRSLIGRAVYWSLVLGLWLVIGVVGIIAWTGAHMPPLQSLEIPKRPPSIQIVDNNGRPLATRGDAGGAVLPLKELPSYVPKAFIAIEDRRFYEHYGVDPWASRAPRSPTFCIAAWPRAPPPSRSNWRRTSFSRKSAPSIASCRRRCWRCGWSGNSPRRRSSNCISTASISAPAPTASSRRRSAISASPPSR